MSNENEISQLEHDQVYNVKKVSPFVSDGLGNLVRQLALGHPKALQVVTSGTTTYMGQAAPGTLTSAAAWSVQKIDKSSGTVITWADEGKFTQVFDDYATLTYS